MRDEWSGPGMMPARLRPDSATPSPVRGTEKGRGPGKTAKEQLRYLLPVHAARDPAKSPGGSVLPPLHPAKGGVTRRAETYSRLGKRSA